MPAAAAKVAPPATEAPAAPVVLSRSQKVAADVSALIRARNPIIWIQTTEEKRVEGYLAQAAGNAGYKAHSWDAAQGFTDPLTGKVATGLNAPPTGKADSGDALDAIKERTSEKGSPERAVWFLRDFAPWLEGPIGMTTLRRLRNLVRLLPNIDRERAQCLIVLSTSNKIPPELSAHAIVIEWPLPDRAEIGNILDVALKVIADDTKRLNACPPERRETAIDAAVGLTGEEAAACYGKSLVLTKGIDPLLVSQEKKRVVTRSGVLEWYDPIPGGLDAVGGLDNLKDWLVSHSCAYSPEARAYGLPFLKGIFVTGVSGCGKSLLAKATATSQGVPLLRLDLNALKGKFVGESEGNIRKALNIIEAVGRCVVWLDEVEKALQGATSGSADGGVSSDALGTILTWMQERKGGAFIIATSNDVTALPPEFYRAGRFDGLWFVDLPNDAEREAVCKAALAEYGRKGLKIDTKAVSKATKDYTGSEIASLVPEAMFAAFVDGKRELTTKDLIVAASKIVPLGETAKPKIDALRLWAKGKARMATRQLAEVASNGGEGRALDLED
jgi:ATPase family associated with various cellular activities (AAA)